MQIKELQLNILLNLNTEQVPIKDNYSQCLG